jgi:hypothetical protein
METTMMQATTNGAAPAKAFKGVGMEGFIANWYARQTGKNLDEFKKLARQLSSRVKVGDRYWRSPRGRVTSPSSFSG